MKGYIPLAIAIIGEVVGTSMLKLSEGFTNVIPSIGFMLGFGTAFYFLSISLKVIPLGTAYAIWAGVGTALTALIGLLIWKEPFSVMTAFGIVLIIAGVVVVNSAKRPGSAIEGQK
ncbi:DMT family transporter [Desmospora activa]|nr:multidrug efflux SMR transporter [Desmospora activa]